MPVQCVVRMLGAQGAWGFVPAPTCSAECVRQDCYCIRIITITPLAHEEHGVALLHLVQHGLEDDEWLGGSGERRRCE